MVEEKMENPTAKHVGDSKDLLGPPPVLASESLEHYQELFERVMAALKPKDIVEQILIRDFVHASWLVARFTRHGTVAVERWFHESLEFEAQRAKLQSQRREAISRPFAGKPGQPADVARLVDLVDIVEESVADVDEILRQTPTEIEHNRALEKGIVFQIQVDGLRNSAIARSHDALKMLEHYRQGLGHHVQKVTEEIIEAEYEEVGVPTALTTASSLSPSNEEVNELGTQENS
jgi:hypothetical protein